MKNVYRLFLALLLTAPAWAAPSMEWGLMIGNNVEAPAGYRELDGFRYDFTVIVKVIADLDAKIDSASLTLTLDTGNGFELPQGETLTKTFYNIPRSTPEFFIWHIKPPASQNTYPNAVIVNGSYTAGGITAPFSPLSRSITVRQIKGTGQYQVSNNTIGDFLAGEIIYINQYVTLAGGNPQHFAWGLFLSRYDVLEVMSIYTNLPGAPHEPHTYLPQTTALPDGTYRITYLCRIKRGNVSMSLNNQFYGLTGQWRGIDSEVAGVGFPDWQVQNQGFKGRVSVCATGIGVAGIPVSVYSCADQLLDNRPFTNADGTYSFGLREAGQYKLYFNDPSHTGYDPAFSSYYDDNGGNCYSLSLDQTITANACLSELTSSTGSLDTIRITPYTTTVPVGNTVIFTATGYDANGVQLPADSLGSLTWSGASAIGVLADTVADRIFFTAQTAGYDTIRVRSSINGASGRTGAVFVESAGPVGTLASLSITPHTATTSLGNTLVFTARGYDAAGNELPLDSLGTLTWGGGSAIGTYAAQQNNIAYFTASATGTDTLTVSTDVNGTTARTGNVTVVGGIGSGPLYSIGIIPSAPTATVGDNVLFQAIAYDSLGNQLPSDSLRTLTWSGGGAIGTIIQNNNTYIIFDAQTPGTDVLQARSSNRGITGSTGTVTVVSPSGGSLVRIALAPFTASVETGDTLAFRVTGYDSDNAAVPAESLGTLTWFSAAGLGTFSVRGSDSALFSAGTIPGTDTVSVTSSRGPAASTGSINIVMGVPVIGPPVRLAIAPDTATGAQDTTLIFTVTGYDSVGNVVPDTALERYLVWSGGGTIGVFTDRNGLTGALEITTAGTDRIIIRDTLRGITDTSGTITATAGTVARITVTDVGGTEIGAASLTTDDDGTTYYVRAYTQSGNQIGGVTAAWNTTGAAIATLSLETGGATALTLNGTGQFRLIAEYAPGITDTTGTITVTGGTATVLSVTPVSGTVSADDSLRFTVTATDADGSSTTLTGPLTWSAGGGITGTFNPNGTVNPSAWFIPVQAGSGYVAVVNPDGITDTAGAVTVTAGDTAALRIYPATPDTLYLDERRDYTARGYDAKGNLIGPVAADWDTSGTLNGTFSGFNATATFTFISGTAGSGRIIATLNGTMRDSVNVTVLPTRIDYIKVVFAGGTAEVDNILNLTTDSPDLSLAAAGYAAGGTFIGYVSAVWNLPGDPVGTLSQPFGRTNALTFTTPGEARVTAAYQNRSTDSTGIIRVTAGRAVRFTVTPHTASLFTYDTLACSATGHDADDNITDDTGTLTWSTAAGIGTVTGSGGSAAYMPVTPGTDTLTVTSSYGGSGSSGTYRVTKFIEFPARFEVRRDSSRLNIGIESAIICTLIAIDRFGQRITDRTFNPDTIRLEPVAYDPEGTVREPAGTVTLTGPGITTDADGYVIMPDSLYTGGTRLINVGYTRSGEYLRLVCVSRKAAGDSIYGISDRMIWEAEGIITSVSAYPSPMNFNRNPLLSITYVLKMDARVEIYILSPLGSLMKKIICEKGDSGGRKWLNTVTWDGRTHNGKPAASGSCLIRINVYSELGDVQETIKTGIIGIK